MNDNWNLEKNEKLLMPA